MKNVSPAIYAITCKYVCYDLLIYIKCSMVEIDQGILIILDSIYVHMCIKYSSA